MSTVNQGNSGQNINQKSPTKFENGVNIPIVDTNIAPSDFNGIAIDSVTGNFIHGVSGVWKDTLVNSKNYTDSQITALQASVQSGTYPAIPTTNPTVSPYVGKYSFQATVAGTYTNFSGIVVILADVAIGKETYLESFDSGATWTKRVKTIVDTSVFVTHMEFDPVDSRTLPLSTEDSGFNIKDEQGNPAFRINLDGSVDFYKITTFLQSYLKSLINPYLNEDVDGFVLKDGLGNEALSISSDGVLTFYELTGSTITYLETLFQSKLPIEITVGDGDFLLKDEQGNVGFGVLDDGSVDIYKLTQQAIDYINSVLDIPSSNSYTGSLENYADINHIINYGQSLGVGLNQTVLTTSALFPNLICFDGVMRTSPYDLSLTGDTYPTNRRIAFAPAVERTNNGTSPNTYRESPSSGTGEMLALSINNFAYLPMPTLAMKILLSAPGQGNTTLAQLSKPSAYYTRVLQDVQAGYDLANAAGKTYKVLAVTWTQGENDYVAHTTTAAYKTAMNTLKTNLNADIKAITGQLSDIAIVMYQTATSYDSLVTYPNIAMAQLELCLAGTGFYMATPMYQFAYNDHVHINSVSAKLMGGHYGFAINKIFSESISWKPIHVKSTTIQGNLLQIKFDVPQPPLQFSVANGVTLTNKGFQVISGGTPGTDVGGTDIVTSVSLGNTGDTVNILCSGSPVGCIIRYGVNVTAVTNSNVNLGNLRDSQGDKIIFPINNTEYPMHNWTPIFEYQL